MRIAIIVNGRPHESGVTSYINTISDAFRSSGHLVDVITQFGVSRHRNVKTELTKRSDRLLQGRAVLVILAYLISKIIILWHLFFSHIQKRYHVLYAIDVSAANVAILMRRIAWAKVFLRIGSSVAKDMVAQGKLAAASPLLSFFYREERRAYSRVDGVIPNSTWSFFHVTSLSPRAKVLQPIISPVDQRKFYPNRYLSVTRRREMRIKGEDVVILFPSRLDIRKGPFVALEALKDLLKRSPHYKLIYSGHGTEKRNLERRILELKLDSFVHLLGEIPHEEMPVLYNMANVVIIPSISHHGYEEPLANCVMEAMACGIPVIASAIGGLKDFIISGKNGVLFPEGDFSALANEIELLVSRNDNYSQRLINGGLNTVYKNCSPQTVIQKLINIFDSRNGKKP